ncbi:hypothetical protein BKA66DRAFT_447590 [Pyrenochaeta sp. MPI-SDFR-AT-0127]|nr:hypothetical protein BKA66DRAFT_447590 [Pyrenochaeta sp. MPI-SDFR-AT-0127]
MSKLVTRKDTRLSTPRARTGCQTCRKRHIKCDESTPSCLKCIQAGWKCDGYTTLKLARGNNNTIIRASMTSAHSITSYSIPFRIPGSQKDRQIFHYLCVQGSSEIAGSLDSGFWSRTVLQESHQEPVVLKALISLGSLHLDYTTTTTPGNIVAKSETLAAYGRALRALQKRLQKPDPETFKASLVCCVLFFCFEATLGNSNAALNHLESGLKLLSSYRQVHGYEKIEDIRDLSHIFERLDLQATLFNDGRVPFLDLVADDDLSFTPAAERISRLDDAYRPLLRLQHWLSRFLTKNMAYKFLQKEDIPDHILVEKEQIVRQMNSWMSKFGGQAYRGDQTGCATQILLLQWRASCMLLDANYPTNEDVFEACPNLRAEEIMALAGDVIRLTKERNIASDTAKSAQREFSSDTAVVAPLFLLAMKCSDQSIYARATELLEVCQRREGLYDSRCMASTLRQLRAMKPDELVHAANRPIAESENQSLENLRAYELNQRTGGMDSIVDFI